MVRLQEGLNIGKAAEVPLLKKGFLLSVLLCAALLLPACGARQASVTGEPEETKTQNEAEPAGYSAGNISQGGLMGGGDGWIYYRSETDSWHPYKARTNGGDKQKLSDDVPCSINALDGWVYYSNYSDGFCLYKIKTDGTERTKLTTIRTDQVQVAGDTIYFESYEDDAVRDAYQIKTDGSGLTLLAENCRGMVYDNGTIYFTRAAEKDGFCIFRMNADGTGEEKLNSHYSFYLNVQNGYLYYLSVDELALRRMKCDGSEDKILIRGVDHINVSGDGIYYVNAQDSYNLYFAGLDGKNPKKLTNFTSFQLSPDANSEKVTEGATGLYLIDGIPFARGLLKESNNADGKMDCLLRAAGGEGAKVWD